MTGQTPPPFLDYEPRWSNCLFWAAHQLQRHGGYGLVRRGHHGVPFHVLWMPPGTFEAPGGPASVWSYEPLRPLWRPSSWRSDLLLLFRGHVVEGDSESNLPNAYVDPLTELFNRRYLATHLEREIARAKRYKTALSLLMIDIDDFPEIETRYGQAVGDGILKTIGRTIGRTSRSSDTGVHYDRATFLVIAPQTDRDGAAIFGERLRRAIHEAALRAADGASIRVSASIGVAPPVAADETAESLIAKAALALKEAKQEGGNRVQRAAER